MDWSAAMGSISINGISVGYDDVGSGPPLVLVHGHPFNRSMWRPQVEHFGRTGWRVIAADLRGYGESTVVPGTTTLQTFAADLAGLLDALEVDDFVLGGLSMGGQIVMECHQRFPQRIRGLVLADTSALADSAEGRRLRLDTADRLVREGMAPYAEEVLPKMLARQNVAALPDVAAHVLTMMRTTDPQGAAAALRGRAERPDYLDGLRAVTAPTAVVVGRDDEYTPIGDARLMHERIAGSTLVVIDDAGHMPNLERPEAFNAAVQRVLNAVTAGRS
jgi:pimeloyl-ACP methyl ester carboxylesterase